ncbi:MAG TPA: flagellar basal body rod protein FlgB [Desulfobacteraceae bacterium]|nr:flagellar basal body rod protein FlgB [Desulfobacteraceae bacterium]
MVGERVGSFAGQLQKTKEGKEDTVTDASRLYNRTYEMLSSALDVSARRHNLITGNIANVDTIGYKPSDLDFQKTLENVMDHDNAGEKGIERTHNRHFSGVGASFHSMAGRNSEDVDLQHLDSVNIDTEMTNLVENNIKYRTTTEMLLRKMTILRHAIREGGK